MGHAGAIISGGAGHRGVQGRGPRGGRVPGRRLAHRAAGAPARRRATAAERADGPSRHPLPVRVTTAGRRRGCSMLAAAVDDATGPRPNVDRRARARRRSSSTSWARTSAGGTACSGADRRPRRARRRSHSPRPTRCVAAWEAEWPAIDAWLDGSLDDAGSTTRRRWRPLWQMLAHVVNHGTQHRARRPRS